MGHKPNNGSIQTGSIHEEEEQSDWPVRLHHLVKGIDCALGGVIVQSVCGFFFSFSALISSLLCIVDSTTTVLFVYGAHETSVQVSSVKAKTDSNAVRFFSTNSFGSSLRVFLTVPNSVRFCRR